MFDLNLRFSISSLTLFCIYYLLLLLPITPNSAPSFSSLFQVMQAQLDASTQAASDLRERAAEKDVALELTSSHLQQEDAARKTMEESVKAALSLLHHAVFQVVHHMDTV